MLLTQMLHVYYEELCLLDVLGLADTTMNDQGSVYNEIKEQLGQLNRSALERKSPGATN